MARREPGHAAIGNSHEDPAGRSRAGQPPASRRHECGIVWFGTQVMHGQRGGRPLAMH
jgi:hypothetical protein